MDLSIIIPVYQVEKYIRACIESIFQQGLSDSDYEVIIVDDGTKDNSMGVIADIISQHQNITVIHQENQGLSVARNKGLAIAKGEYTLMLDSDDLLIGNRIKPLLETALTSKADIVIADYIQMGDDEIEKFLESASIPEQPKLELKEATGIELLDESLCRYYWRNLYRKAFLEENNISFIPGITSQDIPFTNECLLRAKRCIRVEWPIVIYRWGHPSTTYSTYTYKRAKDFCVAIASIWELSKTEGLSSSTRERQKDIVFRYFWSLTWKITYGHLEDYRQMTEVLDYLKQLAPDMEFKNGHKQRFYSYMFWHMPHTLIKLKYFQSSVNSFTEGIHRTVSD